MKISKTKIIPIILLIFIFGFLAIRPVFAEGSGIFQGIESCRTNGNCSLCDFLTLATNISRWILSVMGGLAMVYFIWFGIGFIMSFGNAEKVAENKKGVIGAVIGILIIMVAWTLVNFIFVSFVQNPDVTSGAVKVWGSTPWSTLGGMCPLPEKK
ncbi:MAG: pilin [bacterium]